MTAEKNPFAKFLTHFDNGQVLFHEGDDGDDMYIIQSGRVAIKKKVKDGDTTLAVLEKGDFFGEMAILERLPRSASAEVVEEGDLIVISGEMFGDMIKANPEIAVRMLRKQSIRLRETNKQLESVMAGRGHARAGSRGSVSARRAPTSGTLQAEAQAYFISPVHRQRLPGVQQRGAARPLRLRDRHAPRGRPHQGGPEPQHLAPARAARDQGRKVLHRRRDRHDERDLPEREEAQQRRAHAHQGRRRDDALPAGLEFQDSALRLRL